MWYAVFGFAALITAGWAYSVKLVATKAPPIAPPDVFTSPGKVQVGDIVSVAMVSAEPASSETQVDGDPFVLNPLDQAVLNAIPDSVVQSGAMMQLQITRATFPAPGGSGKGQPISIGIIVDPKLSGRVPAVFLDGSVQRIIRNGQVVTS